MVFFIFIQVLIKIRQANNGDPDQMPHSVASDLDLHCLPMSHKKDPMHIWVKNAIILLSHKSFTNLRI